MTEGRHERFESFDGLEIAFLLAGGEEEGSAVILHHGFASTSEINWVRPGVVADLVAAGRRVVAIDARGHGGSGRPHEPSSYAGDAMARDVRALADHLGLERIDLAGYSMGSLVSIGVASSDGRVRSLFLGGAGLGQIEVRQPEKALLIAEALEATDPASVSDPTARAFRNFADATRQDRLALAAIQRVDRSHEGDLLEQLRVPTLVVSGENDTLVGDPGRLAARIAGARSLLVPGDHISAVTKAEFKKALVDWETQW